ncbi:hypothetical protein JNW87_21535 [Micromonospora sp. ATA51]|nr:hypothetical protein [Micromonospora sp. ATA51]
MRLSETRATTPAKNSVKKKPYAYTVPPALDETQVDGPPPITDGTRVDAPVPVAVDDDTRVEPPVPPGADDDTRVDAPTPRGPANPTSVMPAPVSPVRRRAAPPSFPARSRTTSGATC